MKNDVIIQQCTRQGMTTFSHMRRQILGWEKCIWQYVICSNLREWLFNNSLEFELC